MREGIYYRIESTNMNGKERQILHEGTHQKPFGIAVDKESVYWTDLNNKALWKKRKNADETPEKIRGFPEKPMGLVVKNLGVLGVADCFDLISAMNETSGENIDDLITTTEKPIIQCLNDGNRTSTGCKCRRGYTGSSCEISVCYNYCVHGSCYYESGYPKCKCPEGFSGSRCERNVCEGFCLNGGSCRHSNNIKWGAECTCEEGYAGSRCEKSYDVNELCKLFCEYEKSEIFQGPDSSFICR